MLVYPALVVLIFPRAGRRGWCGWNHCGWSRGWRPCRYRLAVCPRLRFVSLGPPCVAQCGVRHYSSSLPGRSFAHRSTIFFSFLLSLQRSESFSTRQSFWLGASRTDRTYVARPACGVLFVVAFAAVAVLGLCPSRLSTSDPTHPLLCCCFVPADCGGAGDGSRLCLPRNAVHCHR